MSGSSMKIKKRHFLLYVLAIAVLIIVFEFTTGFSDGISVFYRIAVAIIALYCVIKGIKENNPFNPYFYFFLTPLSLLLYTDIVSTIYLNTLTDSTWLIGIINMVAFLLALNYVSKGAYLKKYAHKFIVAEYVPSKIEKYNLIFNSIILLFIGNIPTFFSMLEVNFPLASILSYFIWPGIVMAWKSKNRLLLSVIYVILLLSFMISFNKSMLLGLIIVTIISYTRYYSIDKKRTMKLVISCIIVIYLFIFVAFPLKQLVQEQKTFSLSNMVNAVTSYGNTNDAHYLNKIVWSGPAVLQLPYMYFVSAWNNVQYVMETQNWHTYGLWMLKPLISYLQMDDLFQGAYALKSYSSFNTYTYITVLYKDFGLYGSIIGSAFLGVYVGWLYNRYRRSQSAFDVAIYAVVSQATIEMFFSNHFFSLSYPFTIVIICWLYKVLCKSARAL